MSDVELAIKIPEESYEFAKECKSKGSSRHNWNLAHDHIVLMVANGTPLPKGHSNLIDVQNAVDNLMEYKEIGIFGNYDKQIILGCIDRIKNHVEPIIEADKRKSDEPLKWEPGNSICPSCGEDKFKGLDADIWSDWQPKFCPNCGMRIAGDYQE